MIGRKNIFILINVLFWLGTLGIDQALSITVTDPTSYTYYVEQLEKMERQLTNAQKSLQTVQDLDNRINQYQYKLERTYNKGQGMVRKMRNLQKGLENRPKGNLRQQARYWVRLGEDGLKVPEDMGEYASSVHILSNTFKDPRLQKDRKKVLEDLDKRYQTRQVAIRESIVKSEEVLTNNEEKLKNIKNLSIQIDETQNMKEATDLQNRLLAEILAALTEQLELWAHIGESQGLMNFSGVDENVSKIKREERTQKRDPRDKSRNRKWVEERLGKDLDKEEMTMDDIMKLGFPSRHKP